ncbi:MAG: hypothetical protein F7C35_05695 [Desulfurococcales archaeon]|nr:hypothetical protein [Desulfurococcales archaeon]
MGNEGRVTLVLPVRPSRVRKRLKSGVKEYVTYRITIPQEAAQALGLEGEAALIVTLERPRWYHLFNWGDPEIAGELWERLTETQRRKVCLKGLAPRELCGGRQPITILADPDRLRELGLDPEKPLTLEDVVERVRERVREELRRELGAKPTEAPPKA